MRVISLIAAETLDPALVSSLQSAWGAVSDAAWLSATHAAEFMIENPPSNLEEVRADIAGMGVDVNCLPSENRIKKLLIADMDSTMIEQECIDELADVAGVGPRVADITARAMNGELDFEEAVTERVGLLAGLPTAVVQEVLDTRITYAAGGRTLVQTMKAHGARAALVSGGFVQFTSQVAATLGFDEHQANQLIEDNGAFTGDVSRPILGREAKVTALKRLCEELGISTADAVTVGDGANDLGMLDAAGLGVAVHAKPSVAAAAPYRVDHGDLTALLYLQGIPESAFARD